MQIYAMHADTNDTIKRRRIVKLKVYTLWGPSL